MGKAKEQGLNKEYVQAVTNAPKFGIKDKLGYMFGDLGFNSLQVIVNTYFMLFCVNVLGVKATHYAVIIFICKLLDACNDTIIGRTVDKRPATKYGKMRPYLKWFAIPYAVLTVVIFANVTAMPYVFKIVWILVIYFIWGIIGTFINVPYGAMSNIITTNQVERTELSNFRSIGSYAANIGVTTLAPLMLYDENSDPIASRFLILSIGLGIFCTVCLALSYHFTHERVLVTEGSGISAAANGGKKVNYWQVIKSFGKNRIMIAVVLAYVVAKLFTQTVSTTNQYVFMVYFQDTTMLSMASLVTIIPMIIAMVFLKPLVKKFGKKNLCTWPVLIAAVFYGITAFAPMTPVTWIICQVCASCFTACMGLLLWSLIADAVDYQAYLTGERNDGTVYATITFIVFFAGSASTSLIALVLEWLGYDATLGSMGQLAGVAERIKIFGGVWPMIGCILTFICYKLIYNVSDEEMRHVSATLKQRSDEEKAKILAEDSSNGKENEEEANSVNETLNQSNDEQDAKSRNKDSENDKSTK